MDFLNHDPLGDWEMRPFNHPYGLRSKPSHLSSLSKMSSVGAFPQPADPYTMQHRTRASTTTTAISGDVPIGVAYTTTPIEDPRAKEQNQAHVKHHRMSLHRKKSKLEDQMPAVFRGADTIEGAHTRMKIKNEIIAACGEFAGTFLFLFFSFGIATMAGQTYLASVRANPTQPLDTSQLQYSSLGFGFALACNVWAFFRVSGGLFNPALNATLMLTGSITWYRALILTPVQIGAALLAAEIADLLIPGGLQARVALADGVTVAQGFFIEFLMTAQLTMVVFMLAIDKHKSTHLASVGIGLSLFISELWATPLTGGALNPARALGPAVIMRHFERHDWIYYTAPFAGALFSTGIYKLFKWLQYETSMGDADHEGMHMLMRDTNGRLTGFVDQVSLDSMPVFIKKHMEDGIVEAVHLNRGEEGTMTQNVVALNAGQLDGIKVEQSP